MDATEMRRYVEAEFAGVRTTEAYGDTFFLYDPDGDLPPERQMPFATIVTGDHYEKVSKLDGRDAYRLNIGLTKATYTAMFGDPPTERDADGVLATGYDQTAEDTLMPHPVYGSQYWVCVVNPGAATLPAVRSLLAEAHDYAARKHANHRRRAGAG
ncbi:DUF6194 family protein [Phytohabitans flavus]|uniref:DUF6194 domain-containing protein n=1 Tax=Phytohabitans flavus TaxID=1076124 RepID=A0A6F8XPU2_9ACTN|nr:DUF6194 family protein [Phytohabitans flavus]BCB75852.1 hypothetical protein Pflav_022620 [Phytohabitans flavus]